MSVLEGESSRQKQELGELQARLCQEEQKKEEARCEAFALKQRVLECDAGREAALNEVHTVVSLFSSLRLIVQINILNFTPNSQQRFMVYGRLLFSAAQSGSNIIG